MKINLIFFLFTFFSFCTTFSQEDLSVIYLENWTYPWSGCDTGGSTDQIQLAVRNNSSTQTSFGSWVYLNYQIDGGPIVRDSIPTLGPSAVWTFMFDDQIDFSSCNDTFNIKTWVSFNQDPDQTNDTLEYEFINFCSIIPGLLYNDSTHADQSALDTLELLGSQYHTSLIWESSIDSMNWSVVTGSSTRLPYAFEYSLRFYRVILDNPYCDSDTSNMVKIRYLDSTLFVSLQSKVTSIRVFPNPAHEFLFLYSEESYEVTLLNSAGKIMEKRNLKKGNNLFDILSYPAGRYYIQFKSDYETSINSFIKLE